MAGSGVEAWIPVTSTGMTHFFDVSANRKGLKLAENAPAVIPVLVTGIHASTSRKTGALKAGAAQASRIA